MAPFQYSRVSSQENAGGPAQEDAEVQDSGHKHRKALLFIAVFTAAFFYFNLAPVEPQKAEPAWKTKLSTENFQNRPNVHLGKPQQGFRLENQVKLQKRLRDMRDLDQVRMGYCGSLGGGRWAQKRGRDPSVMYFNSSETYATTMTAMTFKHEPFSKHSDLFSSRKFSRWLCDGPHPRLPNMSIRIERMGPFYGNGNNDWNTGIITLFTEATPMSMNALQYKNFLWAKPLYIAGRMFAIVHRNGTLVDYPPLHTHHAHIYPDSAHRMDMSILPAAMREPWRPKEDRIPHHVLIQAHGDTICKDEDGGLACLLDQLPDGYGYRVVNTTGFIGNFEVNDVRPKGSPKLEFFVDVAIVYSRQRLVETTFLQMGNPFVGLGWNTYQMPLDPNSNVMFFNLTNRIFGDGVLNDFVLHTHMSYFDAIYVFKGNGLYQHLDEYRIRRNASLPMVFECLPPRRKSSKDQVLSYIQNFKGSQLVCEGTKPSQQLYCTDEKDCVYRDKRIQFNCRRDVRFAVNETLTVVAFNQVRNFTTQPISRSSSIETLSVISPFGGGYTATQHSFFRANFVSDRAKQGKVGASSGDAVKDAAAGAYAPPSIFFYTSLPYRRRGLLLDAERVIENCPKWMNFDVDLPWNVKKPSPP